jgi:iron complex outermembrane receptor protein
MLLIGATLGAQAPISRAWAQSLDTGALEQVFGEPVTSSATGRPQLVSEAPADMEIITQDDIRRSGATSIPDILQFLPGLDVRRYGMGDVDVGIRGYNQPYNPRLLVLVNGREVYEQAYGHVPWEEIPVQLSEIRQIEVIKGPNSALYGFNAVSGVINIITYDPLVDSINTATLSTGTQDYQGGSAVGTARICNSPGVHRCQSTARHRRGDVHRSQHDRQPRHRRHFRRRVQRVLHAHQFTARRGQRRHPHRPAKPWRLPQRGTCKH